MVICPIALAVHCTGCPFVKFCPAKTILGDYGKDGFEDTARKEPESGAPGTEKDDDAKPS